VDPWSELGNHMVSVEREPITGAQPHQGLAAEPPGQGSGVRGEAHEAETFFFAFTQPQELANLS